MNKVEILKIELSTFVQETPMIWPHPGPSGDFTLPADTQMARTNSGGIQKEAYILEVPCGRTPSGSRWLGGLEHLHWCRPGRDHWRSARGRCSRAAVVVKAREQECNGYKTHSSQHGHRLPVDRKRRQELAWTYTNATNNLVR